MTDMQNPFPPNSRGRLRRVREFFARHVGDTLAILFLAAFPLVYFWQAAVRQAVFFFGDIFLFFYPTHLAYANALREGRLPLWEPRMLTGFPLFAEGQIAALYPTHPFLYGLLPMDVATNYDILFHLSWVAVGTYLFLRTIKLHPAAAVLGGLAFSFGGFFLPRLQHMSVLATASWLPWDLWAWEQHERAPTVKMRWRWFVVLAIFFAIQLLGGHPQFAFLSAVMLALYSLVNWQRDPGAPESRRLFPFLTRLPLIARSDAALRRRFPRVFAYFDPPRVILFGLAAGLGALVASAQLFSTFELSGVSNRATGLLPKFFNAYSLRLPHYLMLFNPFLLGNPFPHVSVEVIGYIGFLPVILALAALFVRRDRRVVFFLLIAFLALFFGLGDQNAFYRGLRYLPLFGYFRVPSRFFYWYTFAAAVLAAFAFDWLIARAPATPRLTRGQKFALLLATLLIALVAGIAPAIPVEAWLALWQPLPLALAFVTAWIILGARRGLFTRTTLIALVIGLSAVDLALFASVYAKTYDATTTVEDFYRPPTTMAVLKNLSPQEGRILTSLWIYPWLVTMRESMYPNISLIWDVPNAIGYTPLIPQLTGDYLEEMSAAMVNLMNVRYYILPQMLPSDPKTEGADLFIPLAPPFVTQPLTFAPTPTVKLKVVSSLAQSVAWRTGEAVAQIELDAQDGARVTIPLRAGNDTAEWAYERSDVRRVIQHAMPPVATTFPAQTAFPPESHPGHNFVAYFDVTRDGKPIALTRVAIQPIIDPGLLHIERIALVQPDGSEISLAHLTGYGDYTLSYRTHQVAVMENHDTLPRVFLAHRAQVVADATALETLRSRTFKPQEMLLLAGGTPLDAAPAPGVEEFARVVSYQPERVVLAVRANTDAYVFLGDAWYPSWVARVDGVETPIQRADLIFRAVRVSPGDHQIEFEYRPVWLYLGVIVTGLTLALLGAILAATRAPKRN